MANSSNTPLRRFTRRILNVFSSNGHACPEDTPRPWREHLHSSPVLVFPGASVQGQGPAYTYNSWSPQPRSHRAVPTHTPPSSNSSPRRRREFTPRVVQPDPAAFMSSFDANDVLDRFPAVKEAYVSPTGMRGSLYPTPPSTSTPPSTGYRTPPGTRFHIHNDLKLPPARGRRPAVVYNFASGSCQRAQGRRRAAITPEQLTEPATQPHVRALRIVSRQLPWRTEVRASAGRPYVSVGDVLRAVRETAALPVNEPEFNIVSSPRRRGIRAAFRRRGGRAFLLRADALEDASYLGGMAQDDGFVAQFHNALPRADEPPVFVMKFVDLAAALERAGLEPASSRPTSRW